MTGYDCGVRLEGFRTNLQSDGRIGHEVVKPVRVDWSATLRREYDPPIAFRQVHQGMYACLSGLRTGGGKKQQRPSSKHPTNVALIASELFNYRAISVVQIGYQVSSLSSNAWCASDCPAISHARRENSGASRLSQIWKRYPRFGNLTLTSRERIDREHRAEGLHSALPRPSPVV